MRVFSEENTHTHINNILHKRKTVQGIHVNYIKINILEGHC